MSRNFLHKTGFLILYRFAKGENNQANGYTRVLKTKHQSLDENEINAKENTVCVQNSGDNFDKVLRMYQMLEVQ